MERDEHMQKLSENLASRKEERHVVQCVGDCTVARRKVGWVNGGLVRKGCERKECGLMWKGSY